jgi:WD40 repeat protein
MPDDNTDHELSLDDIFSRQGKRRGAGKDARKIPFKFLDSYTREDRNIFFGRDNETDEIFRKFYSGKLLLVYGKSGTGKSSIINCGLISRIPSEDIFTINIRCGNKAYGNFVTEIKKYSDKSLSEPIEILEDIFYEHSKPVALIFDQFEEIFILSDEVERKKLAVDLDEILKSRLKINVILIIREEYFANLTEFEKFIPGLYSNRVRIEKMSSSAAKEAIVRPCKACNVVIEDGLEDLVIDQLAWQSEGLELTWLQILMDKLYRTAADRDKENPVITNRDLTNLGRIGNVLSDFLDEQLRLMTDGNIGEAVLKTMISTDGTKKQVRVSDILDSLQNPRTSYTHDQIEEILLRLINVRIIKEKDELGFYELRHDAIAARIYERMTAYEKELIEVKSFLDNSLKIFHQRKVLLSENDLNYIAPYEYKLILNKELKEFVKTSRREAERNKLRRRNITIAAAVGLVTILSAFTIWAVIERGRALDQTKVAEVQKNEALKANQDAENSRLIAIEGENKAKKNEAIALEQKQEALRANREAETSRKIAFAERNKALDNENLALKAMLEADSAKNEVIKASSQTRFYLYLFNGKELANKSLTMQENDSLRALLALSAFDLVTYSYKNFGQRNDHVRYDGEILKALQNSYFLFRSDSLVRGEIQSIVSRNKKIIYSTTPGQISISALTLKNQQELPKQTLVRTFNLPVSSIVRILALEKGTERLACGTIDGNVILVDNYEVNPDGLKIIYNHNNSRVFFLTFVPEKNWLISSSADKTIAVWDLTGQKMVRQLSLNDPVQKFIMPDSNHLIFANSQGQLLLWHLDDIASDPVVVFSGERRQPIQLLAFSNTHRLLAAGSSGRIMIFNITDPDKFRNPVPEFLTMRHKTVISQMEFSPDNNWLVTGSNDAVMLWDLRDIGIKEVNKFEPVIIENNRQLFSFGFDEDSKYLFYGDNRVLHICPIEIKDIYTRLKSIMGQAKLDENEWKYYVKGDLVQPGY